jgi:DNA-binding GntR family transcriptional regulator
MSLLPTREIDPIQRIEIDVSLSARAREAIRTGILSGQLGPGTLHSVKSLADRFGVSRTPVREALIDLSKQGMVRFERNRGVRILEPSVHDLEEIVEIRLLLEPPATYRAVPKISAGTLRELEQEIAEMASANERHDDIGFMRHDRRFHSLILGESENDRLREFIDQLRDLVVARGNSTLGTTRSAQEILAEHRAILERIAAGDPRGAADAMHDHIDRTGRMLIAQEGGSTELLDVTRSYPAYGNRATPP